MAKSDTQKYIMIGLVILVAYLLLKPIPEGVQQVASKEQVFGVQSSTAKSPVTNVYVQQQPSVQQNTTTSTVNFDVSVGTI